MTAFLAFGVMIKPGILSIRTLLICLAILILLCAVEEREEKEI
jgi:hypothetical protein